MNALGAKTFNHSRRVRPRLLLLVPLALLGAAWLVRARLPRPQTEGDKWLWEQAETVPSLSIMRVLPKLHNHQTIESVIVSDRQGIRDLLRSFEKTPPFTLTKPKERLLYSSPLFYLVLNRGSRAPYVVWLVKVPTGYKLLDTVTNRSAATTPGSVAHFQQMVSKIKRKAQQKQRGYRMHRHTI